MNFFSQSKLIFFIKVLFFSMFLLISSKCYAEYYVVFVAPEQVSCYSCAEYHHVVYHHHHHYHHRYHPHHHVIHHKHHYAHHPVCRDYGYGYVNTDDYDYDQDMRTDDDTGADLNIDN